MGNLNPNSTGNYAYNPSQFGGYTVSNQFGDRLGRALGSNGLPFYGGRSMLASVPEYAFNPLNLPKGLLLQLKEGRAGYMKMLFDYVMNKGTVSVKTPNFKLPIEVMPNQRFYLKTGTYTTKGDICTFIVAQGDNTKASGTSNVSKIKTAHPNGNPKQMGDIARIEVGNYMFLNFSRVDATRKTITYKQTAFIKYPKPEVCKVIAVDYDNGTVTVQRNWAGQKRTDLGITVDTINQFIVDASTYDESTNKILAKDAYFILMAKEVKEDEIDFKIANYTDTWVNGMVQTTQKGWGTSRYAEQIARNIGYNSPLARSKGLANQDYFDQIQWSLLYGEASEGFDPETGKHTSTTDGVMAKIPSSHFLAIKDIDYSTVGTTSQVLGSFNPIIFNKMLQGLSYQGSENKIAICGDNFMQSFKSMINIQTQAVSEIKNEWSVEGYRFKTGNGLTLDFVQSDIMSLNGSADTCIIFDPQYYRMINLDGFPMTDVIELPKQNPYIDEGFIEGTFGAIDLNPEAHWVLQLTKKKLENGTDNTTNYNLVDPLGTSVDSLTITA